MNTKTDKITEHYLIPLLLFFGSIFFVVSIFFWNEWINVLTENYLFPFYPLQELGGRKHFLASTSLNGLCYLAITVMCFVSIALNNKAFSIFSITLSLIGFILLFN